MKKSLYMVLMSVVFALCSFSIVKSGVLEYVSRADSAPTELARELAGSNSPIYIVNALGRKLNLSPDASGNYRLTQVIQNLGGSAPSAPALENSGEVASPGAVPVPLDSPVLSDAPGSRASNIAALEQAIPYLQKQSEDAEKAHYDSTGYFSNRSGDDNLRAKADNKYLLIYLSYLEIYTY